MLSNISLSYAQEVDDYSQKLKEMFKVSGSEESYGSVVKKIIAIQKEKFSTLDESFFDKFEQEMLNNSLDQLAIMLTPVYKNHLSIEDLENIIAFYKTPSGQKLALKTPLIMVESIEVGRKWGESIAQKITQKLEEI